MGFPSSRVPTGPYPSLAKRARLALAGIVLSLLAACGGGGGGGAGSAAPATPQPVPLAGRVTFDYVPSQAGQLVYEATEARPVRGAPVEIVEADGTVLATTTTDGDGHYAVQVPGDRTVTVRVLAQLDANGTRMQVTDNTGHEALYAVASPAIASSRGTADLHAPSGWTGAGYGNPRVAAPFAILDTVYRARAKVLDAEPGARFRPLAIHWSTSNRPADGDATRGEIGYTHFEHTANQGHIYVLGAENVNTDEFDEATVAHEWGHYYQWTFSRDDSVGGAHYIDDELDMTVAFSEGWGYGWAGIATGRADLSDSLGVEQAKGWTYSLSDASYPHPGWYSEQSIAAILYRFNHQIGFSDIHAAMKGLVATPAFISIHSFSHVLRQQGGSVIGDALDVLLAEQSIVSSRAAGDPFGTGETNNGGLAFQGVDPARLVLPVYLPLQPASPATVCSVNLFDAPNKLGNYRYVRIDGPTTGSYRVSVSGARRSDGTYVHPAVSVREADRRARYATTSNLGVMTLPAGTTVFAVADGDVLAGKAYAGCVTVQIDAVQP